MMRAMRRLALVACACTVFVAGCGGASQEDEVKQAFDDYTQAVKDKDGEKLCDSIASPELAEMSSDERAKEIDLCKDEFSAGDFGDASDELDDTELAEIAVDGDRATAQVTATVNAKQETSKQETSKLRFLKVDGDWKVRFESR